MPETSIKVRLRGVTKSFAVKGRPVEALAGIDLDIQTGEFLSIVGPSGCGKTTLLRILAGLEQQSGGTIEVARDRNNARPLNSMVFQEQSIFPWLSVRDNVAFGLKAQGMGRGDRYRVAEPWLEENEAVEVALMPFADFREHVRRGALTDVAAAYYGLEALNRL